MRGTFNNREIAVAFWLLVLLAWMLPKASVRKSLAGVLRAFCKRQILVSVCTMGLYCAASVRLLAAVDLWRTPLLKDTIVWFCTSATAMVMRFVTSRESERVFRTVLVENLAIVIILEFLVNTYTFSLPVELVLVPALSLIVMIDVVATSSTNYSAATKITKGMLTVIGLAILLNVVIRAASDLRTLGSLDTVRSVALAPLLSLFFVPYLYLLVLISKYQRVFRRLDIGIEKDPRVKRYARRGILMRAGLSMKKLDLLLRDHLIDITRVQTEADVDRILAQLKDP